MSIGFQTKLIKQFVTHVTLQYTALKTDQSVRELGKSLIDIVDAETFSNWMSGERYILRPSVVKICERYGVIADVYHLPLHQLLLPFALSRAEVMRELQPYHPRLTKQGLQVLLPTINSLNFNRVESVEIKFDEGYGCLAKRADIHGVTVLLGLLRLSQHNEDWRVQYDIYPAIVWSFTAVCALPWIWPYRNELWSCFRLCDDDLMLGGLMQYLVSERGVEFHTRRWHRNPAGYRKKWPKICLDDRDENFPPYVPPVMRPKLGTDHHELVKPR